MQADQQLRASLREIDDSKAAWDEHAVITITDPQEKTACVNDKSLPTSKSSCEELPGQIHRIINSGQRPNFFIRSLRKT
jgi:hypothetical protein